MGKVFWENKSLFVNLSIESALDEDTQELAMNKGNNEGNFVLHLGRWKKPNI